MLIHDSNPIPCTGAVTAASPMGVTPQVSAGETSLMQCAVGGVAVSHRQRFEPERQRAGEVEGV